MRRETESPKTFCLWKLIIPELRVLVLTKRHVGSGNEIGSVLVSFLRLKKDLLKVLCMHSCVTRDLGQNRACCSLIEVSGRRNFSICVKRDLGKE